MELEAARPLMAHLFYHINLQRRAVASKQSDTGGARGNGKMRLPHVNVRRDFGGLVRGQDVIIAADESNRFHESQGTEDVQLLVGRKVGRFLNQFHSSLFHSSEIWLG